MINHCICIVFSIGPTTFFFLTTTFFFLGKSIAIGDFLSDSPSSILMLLFSGLLSFKSINNDYFCSFGLSSSIFNDDFICLPVKLKSIVSKSSIKVDGCCAFSTLSRSIEPFLPSTDLSSELSYFLSEASKTLIDFSLFSICCTLSSSSSYFVFCTSLAAIIILVNRGS